MKGKWHMVKSLRNAMNAAALFVAGATLLMSKGQALAQAAPPMQDESARIGIFMSDNNLARGVFVTQLVPGGPADKVGLRPGDSILAVDAKRVTSPRELQQVVLQHRPGDALELSVSRGGWLRPFRLTSVGQADLAKLSRPRPATATVPLANPRHAFNVAPPSGAGLPSDAWENVSDPYLRAKYTAFGE